MRGRRMMAQILGRGTHENKRRFLLLVSLPSPQSLVTPNPSNGKGSGLTGGLIRVYIHPSCVNSIYIYNLPKTVAALDPSLTLKT